MQFVSLASQGLSRLRRGAAWLALAVAPVVAAQQWDPIEKDGLRDPEGPAVKLLQPPGVALSTLPSDTAGNKVRWVKALDDGHINPRSNLYAATKVQTYDKDVLLDLNGSMPVVRFPHRVHTLWLDCSNCHDHLFKMQRGGTKISMFNILQGEQCGVCHGAVAFPLTECSRCHSVTRQQAKAELAAEAAAEAAKAAQAGPAEAPAQAASVEQAIEAAPAAPAAKAKPAAKPKPKPAAAASGVEGGAK